MLRRSLATLFIDIPCKVPDCIFLVPGNPDLDEIFVFNDSRKKFKLDCISSLKTASILMKVHSEPGKTGNEPFLSFSWKTWNC